MKREGLCGAALLAAVLCSPTGALGHDLGGTRARLVQYEDRHLNLTLLIRLSDVLRYGSPDPNLFRERIMSLAAMSPQAFAVEIGKVQTSLARGVRVRVNGQAEAQITNWRWPSPELSQSTVRLIVMNAMSGGAVSDVHEEPMEADAEVMADRPVSTAAMQFPKALGPVVLVAYRPVQVTVTSADFTPSVRFSPAPAAKGK